MVNAPLRAICTNCHHTRVDHLGGGSCDAASDCQCVRFDQDSDAAGAAPARVARTQILSETLRRIVRRGGEFGDAFYGTLFARHPEMAERFGRLDRHGRHAALWAALSTAANTGATPSALVKRVGESHAADGVQPEEYRLYVSVLLETLSEFVGDEFTPAMAGAWSEVLNDVCATMSRAHGTRPTQN